MGVLGHVNHDHTLKNVSTAHFNVGFSYGRHIGVGRHLEIHYQLGVIILLFVFHYLFKNCFERTDGDIVIRIVNTLCVLTLVNIKI